jgi:proliferating cell nuclear antigen PCNA
LNLIEFKPFFHRNDLNAFHSKEIMTVLFRARTSEGFNFKILGEILHNTLKTISIHITKEGIFSKMIDVHKKLLIDIKLLSTNFSQYVLNTDSLLFGVNISHLYKIISSLKKKDSLILQIMEESPNELQIIVTPRERDHTEVSRISIQNIQSLDIDVPENYNHPVHVSSSKFQKMCKDMLNIGKEIHVYGNEQFVMFECETPGIYKKQIHFGEEPEDPESSPHMVTDNPSDVHYYFDAEQLVRISKISSLAPLLHVYLNHSLPLLIKSQVGSLGTISIFIKSSPNSSQISSE